MVSIFLVLSLTSTQASFTDRVINSFKKLISRFSGNEKKESTFKVPTIPTVGQDQKSATVQRTKSQGTLSETQVKQYNQLYVEEVFKETRNSAPTVNDVSKWYSVLSQGGSNEGVYRALVLDQVYRGLENLNYPPTDEVKKFASQYFYKFLDKSLNQDNLDQLNFYYLKKTTVEKSLEVVDAFLNQDGEDIYQWYGALGAFLAKNFPNAFKSDVRGNPDPEYHRSWAMNVSDQILKSEVIIKLHKVYNSLQS